MLFLQNILILKSEVERLLFLAYPAMFWIIQIEKSVVIIIVLMVILITVKEESFLEAVMIDWLKANWLSVV